MHRLRQRLNQVKERTMKKSLMLSFKQSTWTPSKLWLKTGLHEKVGAGGSKALEPFPAPAEPRAFLTERGWAAHPSGASRDPPSNTPQA